MEKFELKAELLETEEMMMGDTGTIITTVISGIGLIIFGAQLT